MAMSGSGNHFSRTSEHDDVENGGAGEIAQYRQSRDLLRCDGPLHRWRTETHVAPRLAVLVAGMVIIEFRYWELTGVDRFDSWGAVTLSARNRSSSRCLAGIVSNCLRGMNRQLLGRDPRAPRSAAHPREFVRPQEIWSPWPAVIVMRPVGAFRCSLGVLLSNTRWRGTRYRGEVTQNCRISVWVE